MKIVAAVAPEKEAPFVLQELELDEPRPDEVRVRMIAVGVCHTDAVERDGWRRMPFPCVLGHEGAGIVEAIGSAVGSVAVGEHVVLSFSSCGHCANCMTGHPAYCARFGELNRTGRRGDGSTSLRDANGRAVASNFFGQSSFATAANVDERCIVKVDPELPLELVAPLGCGILTGAGVVLNVMRPVAGSSLVVFGAGAVGIAAIMAGAVAGCSTIVAVDVVGSRLEAAFEFGATHVFDATDEDPVARVLEITGGADAILDTTGNGGVFRQAVDSLGTFGHLVVVGAGAPGSTVSFDLGARLLSGIRISLVVEGDAVPREFIPRLLAMHRSGRFPFDRLVKTYRFEDIEQAFADSKSGEAVKPVLLMP